MARAPTLLQQHPFVGGLALLSGLAALSCEGERGPAGPPGTIPGAGLVLTIDKVTIDAERKVQVDFKLSDAAGAPRALTDVTSSWTIAALVADPDTGIAHFSNYLTAPATGRFGTVNQAQSDSRGTYTTARDNAFRYTFAGTLPVGFDTHATHRVAVYSRRPLGDNQFEVANAAFDFVPAGGQSAAADLVATEACNQCHAPLQAHGGFRREVRLCVTCHNPQLADPDTEDPAHPGQPNPLDFNTLVHRIHRGEDLPSLVAAQQANVVGAKYSVIGFQGREFVFGETTAPPMGSTMPSRRGIAFPRDLRKCQTCHQQAPLADEWKRRVTRHACESCHDTTFFGDPMMVPTREHAHAGGPMADDATCRNTCHVEMGTEFDLSVVGSHTEPLKSAQLAGLTFEILSVTGSASGNPVVKFKITSQGQPVTSLSAFDALAITIGGPTTDYTIRNLVRQDVRMGAVAEADGSFTYTFSNRAAEDAFVPSGPTLPADAKGTFAAALEGRRRVTLSNGQVVNEAAPNPIVYFSVDGSPVTPRRKVVELGRCDTCHDQLVAHGGLHRNTEYCVVCHGPDRTDWERRPKSGGTTTDLAKTIDGFEERSVHFKRLIHQLHTGEDLQRSRPFVVYGFGGTPNEFDEIRFPGDRRLCVTCHLPDTFTIEAIPSSALPTLANETATVRHQGTLAHVAGEPSIPPVQSACLACHDTAAAKTHAEIMTGPAGEESCTVCHGESTDAAVTKKHRTQ